MTTQAKPGGRPAPAEDGVSKVSRFSLGGASRSLLTFHLDLHHRDKLTQALSTMRLLRASARARANGLGVVE